MLRQEHTNVEPNRSAYVNAGSGLCKLALNGLWGIKRFSDGTRIVYGLALAD